MSTTNTASGLQKQAAVDHESAAKHHYKAAESHDHNKVSDAKGNSKNAMDCSNTAHKHSAQACEMSAK